MSRYLVNIRSTQVYQQVWGVIAEDEDEALANWYGGEMVEEYFLDTLDDEIEGSEYDGEVDE